MNLGINPLAIGQKPLRYLPWQDAACYSFIYAGQPGLTVVSTRVTVAPNMRNPAQTYTVPATFQGPLTDTSIGGQPTWVADASINTYLKNSNISLGAIGVTGFSTLIWQTARIDASGSGFNTLCTLGVGVAAFSPSVTAEFSGAGISSNVGGVKRTVTSVAGYAQGTAKRVVSYFSGADTQDYIQWGSVSSGLGGTSTIAAPTGATLFNRGDDGATLRGACGVYGIFAIAGANAAARLAAAAAKVAKLDAWAATYYGGSWAALVS